MNCKELDQMTDSYLSDELAVETNHEIFAHLGSCPDCRAEMSVRRNLRELARGAVRRADEFRVDPVFANRLRSRLEGAAKQPRWFYWRVAGLAFASLLAVAFIYGSLSGRIETNGGFHAYLLEMSRRAAGDHEHCGLAKLDRWTANAGKVGYERADFVRSIQTPETEVLEAHDCIFEGIVFTHYILRRGAKIISVQTIPAERAGEPVDEAIVSEREQGFQVASFKSGGNVVFVVSELPETENLAVARTLSDSVRSKV